MLLIQSNYSNEELVLNMLAELSTTSITKAKDPQNLEEKKTKFYINEVSPEDVSSYRGKTYEVTATRRINLLMQLYTSFRINLQ